MTINEFIWKVAEMRDAQKHYLESRNSKVLKAACKLERMVDKQLDTFRYWYDNYPEDSYEMYDANEAYINELKERLDELKDDI